jgi:hypothetical protein
MYSLCAHLHMRALESLACRSRVPPLCSRVTLLARMRATLVATPFLFAHAVGPCHIEKAYSISGTGVVCCQYGMFFLVDQCAVHTLK